MTHQRSIRSVRSIRRACASRAEEGVEIEWRFSSPRKGGDGGDGTTSATAAARLATTMAAAIGGGDGGGEDAGRRGWAKHPACRWEAHYGCRITRPCSERGSSWPASAVAESVDGVPVPVWIVVERELLPAVGAHPIASGAKPPRTGARDLAAARTGAAAGRGRTGTQFCLTPSMYLLGTWIMVVGTGKATLWAWQERPNGKREPLTLQKRN